MSAVSMDPRLRARRVEVLRMEGRRRLRVLVVLAAIAVAALVAWWLVMRSPFLDVDTVEVSGNERTPIETVLETAGVTLGQPLVEVDTSAARAAIATLPWVDAVSSSRSITGEVSFELTERTPVAVLPWPDGWILVDAVGRVLEATAEIPADVVVVEGSTWHVDASGWVSEGALDALDVAALLPAGLRPKVASVQVTEGALDLRLFGGGTVLLGDTAELDAKFLSALTLLLRIDIACLDHIDVRAPSRPVLTRLPGCP